MLLSKPSDITLGQSRNRLLVIDVGLDAIVAMYLATGERGILPNSTIPNVNNPFVNPRGLLLDESMDRFWVADSNGLLVASLLGGSRSILSDDVTPDNVLRFDRVRGMVKNPNDPDELLVADNVNGIKVVNNVTGERSLLSDSPIPGTDISFAKVVDLVVDSERNRLLVVDAIWPGVIAVDLTTRVRTIFLDASVLDSVFPPDEPKSIVLNVARNRAIVADYFDSIVSVDIETGARSLMSGPSMPNSLNMFSESYALVRDQSFGYLLVLDKTLDSIFAVDLLTGERVYVSQAYSHHQRD